MSFKKFKNLIDTKDMNNHTAVWKILISELIGTMFLVLFGCAPSIPWIKSADTVLLSLAAGLTVATIVQFTGHISGGQINPAVSLAMLVTRKMSLIMFVLYVISQCVGAMAGALLLKLLTPLHLQNNLGITSINPNITPEVGFGIEVLITFMMVITAFSVSDSNREDIKGSVPLAIGLSVTISNFFAAHSTGASMNPARSMGPAVIFNKWNHHWIYWAGPCSGAVAAGLIYQTVFQAKKKALCFAESDARNESKLESIDL